MKSYQNSVPGQLSDNGEGGIPDGGKKLLAETDEVGTHRRIIRSVIPVGLLLLFAMAFMGSPIGKNGTIRGQEVAMLQQTSSLRMSADAKPPVDTSGEPQPDYNGEGRYDWQKCKESNDPDCWKNEGERVDSYWHNFGLRMKTFWMNFRKTIHDFFAGGKKSSQDTGETEVETTKKAKKKHHKKTSTVADTEPPTPEEAVTVPADASEVHQ